MTYDLVIHNGTLITVNSNFEIIENGYIAVSRDKIAAVGSTDNGHPAGRQCIDAHGGIIMPGLVNTHNHLPMTLFRGLADDLPLMEWLNDHIFPVEARVINPETVRLGSLLGCAEMLLSGTTTCCDGYFYEEEVAQAFFETGMRGVLGQGVIDYPAPGISDPADNIECARRFVEKWTGISPLISPSVCCHSVYTCSREALRAAKETADRHGVLFQIHAAETKTEREQCLSEHGVSPVGLLKELDILDNETLLSHCVWTDDADISALAESGTAVSINTESNMKLASGIAPVKAFLEAGITVGMGTDGCASNNDLDLFREMDMTAKLHKVHHLDPTVLPASAVLRMATMGGAAALGLGDRIGSIETGKQADIIILDTRRPRLTPMYNPVSHIVYSASGSDVREVMVAGRLVVEDYRLLTVDPDQIMENVNILSQTIMK